MSLGELLAGLNRFFKTGKGLYGNGTHFEMSSLLAWLSAGCQTASVTAFMRLAASEVTVKPKSFRHSSFLLIGKWWKLLKAVRHLTNCQINLCSLLWKMCQSLLSFLDVGFFIDFFFFAIANISPQRRVWSFLKKPWSTLLTLWLLSFYSQPPQHHDRHHLCCVIVKRNACTGYRPCPSQRQSCVL